MAALGDHELRRRQVVDIATGLIVSGGLAAATTRNIAQAAGCSTTVVSHYFADKRDLLLATYGALADRVTERVSAAGATGSAARPADPLRASLAALMPLDEIRRRDWRLLLAFLGLAATDVELGDEQQRRAAASVQRIVVILDREKAAGSIDPRLASAEVARRLLAFVTGLSIQALFEPSASTNRLNRALAAELDAVVGPRQGPVRAVAAPGAPRHRPTRSSKTTAAN